MITNIHNKDQKGMVTLRATSLNPRWKEGTIKTMHLSIAKIWLAKGWVVEVNEHFHEPITPDLEVVKKAKAQVKRKTVPKKKSK